MASVGLGLFTNAAPYHLLAYPPLPSAPGSSKLTRICYSYGTLFGTQIHQTFLVGTAGYRALERPSFRALQSALFPIYFALQSALPVVLAATYPGNNALPGSFRGVVAPENVLTVFAPLTTMLLGGLTNFLFVGPWTTRIMLDRVEQGTCTTVRPALRHVHPPVFLQEAVVQLLERVQARWLTPVAEKKDGKKVTDPSPHSPEMQRLTADFGKAHGISTLLNLAAVCASGWYAFGLGARIL